VKILPFQCEARHCGAAPGLRERGKRSRNGGAPPMQATIAGNPIIAIRATVRLVRAAPGPVRLCRVLVDAWLRRLERRIVDDLRWLDHDGLREDFRRSSRG
jgi:hypothetical protein